MLNDESLRRLEEMEIDVYAPRGARRSTNLETVSASLSGGVASAREPARARVVLLARAEQQHANALLAHIARALASARIDGAIETAIDETRLVDAAGIVVFGDALVRQAGAALSAERRKNLQWAATSDIADIAISPAAKRALWSELKRVMRAIGAGR